MGKGSERKNKIEDHPHDFLTTGSHKATETDNITENTSKKTDSTNLDIKGPAKTIIKVNGPAVQSGKGSKITKK